VVGPDGYTIDLNLTPQVAEFEGHIGHGDSMSGRLSPNMGDHPIFSTRKVTTSVSIFDGSTVVLSGLVREDVSQGQVQGSGTDDVPSVGPPAGPTAGQQMKRKLLVFVSARLASAGSSPVRSDDEEEEAIDIIAPPETLRSIELPLMPK